MGCNQIGRFILGYEEFRGLFRGFRRVSKSFYEVHEELEHEKITLKTVSPQIDDASRSLIESSRRKFSH